MPRMYTNPHCQFTSKLSFSIYCCNHPHLFGKFVFVARFDSLILRPNFDTDGGPENTGQNSANGTSCNHLNTLSTFTWKQRTRSYCTRTVSPGVKLSWGMDGWQTSSLDRIVCRGRCDHSRRRFSHHLAIAEIIAHTKFTDNNGKSYPSAVYSPVLTSSTP